MLLCQSFTRDGKAESLRQIFELKKPTQSYLLDLLETSRSFQKADSSSVILEQIDLISRDQIRATLKSHKEQNTSMAFWKAIFESYTKNRMDGKEVRFASIFRRNKIDKLALAHALTQICNFDKINETETRINRYTDTYEEEANQGLLGEIITQFKAALNKIPTHTLPDGKPPSGEPRAVGGGREGGGPSPG